MDFASLEPLEGGWSGETFLARVAGGAPQVVRIHARNPGRAEVDAALLRLVRGLLPVPDVLDVRPPSEGGADGEGGGGLPALLITSYLPGERGDLVLPRLPSGEQEVLGASVGRLLATLSGMPQPHAGEFTGVVDGVLEVRRWSSGSLVDACERALREGLHHWTTTEQEGLVEVADLAEGLLDAVERRCLVHCDVNPKNLLVDPATLEVTGLVDWEYAHAGHPSTDLGNVLRLDRAPAYVEAVVGSYRDRVPAAERALDLVDRARAADLWALLDLAGRRGENPVADRADALLRAIARSRDLHATPGSA